MTDTSLKLTRQPGSAKRGLLSALKYALLIFFAAIALIPFVWMLSSSLKTSADVFSIPMRWVPQTFRWENYSAIWDKVALLTYFKNTAIVAVVVTAMQIIANSVQGSDGTIKSWFSSHPTSTDRVAKLKAKVEAEGGNANPPAAASKKKQ